MKYDFSTVIDRRGKDAAAIDGVGHGTAPGAPKDGFDLIPMWVADMNFATVPTVPEAMIERAKHPLYGYFGATDEYYDSIINWQKEGNGVTGLTKECIGYENGVLGGVTTALNVYCSRGDNVLIHAPTYSGFVAVLDNLGYHAILSQLQKDENNVWRMDYEDMERQIVEKNIHAAIICSPHNPCGRVWERWELEKAMELFKKHDVMVVSDEIWSDLTLDGYQHIPTQSVSEDAKMRTVAMYAPSKTFNLAGLVGSYHIIYNKTLRDRVAKESSLCRYNEMNVISMHALIGAYKPEGREWLKELRHVLTENANYAVDYIESHFDGVTCSRPQGTYMVFMDCSEWCRKHGKTLEELLQAGFDVGVAWQTGTCFNAACSIRLNLALPLSRVKEAFDRMDKYVFNA